MLYTCEQVKDMLSLYIDNDLRDVEQAAVKEHLKTCDDCKSEYEFLSGIVCAANTMPTLSVGADLHAKIMHAATKPSAKKPFKRSLWRITSGFATAAAVIAISVISFGSLPGHPDLTKAPVTEPHPPAIQTPAEQTEVSPMTPEEEVAPSVVSISPNIPVDTPSQAVAPQDGPAAPVIAGEPVIPSVEEPAAFEGEGVEDKPAVWSRVTEAVTCYYIGEESYEEAVLILDVYEFDGLAYLIPAEEKETVCEKLQALSGFVRYTEEGDGAETVRIALSCE